MALSIKSAKADQLARDLAELTGESITEVVVSSLEARLELERRRRGQRTLVDVVERFQALPILDDRQADEIIGYDQDGLPA